MVWENQKDIEGFINIKSIGLAYEVAESKKNNLDISSCSI